MQKAKILLATLAATATLTLAGCALHPDWVDLGEPVNQVVEAIGAPDARQDHQDGSFTLVYSQQPFGFETIWMHFDKNGRFVGKELTMNEEHFALVKPGIHTQADIYRLFGRFAQEYDFKLQDQSAYMYRFLDVGGMRMAFWVQFDRAGVVTEWAITQDPWDNDGDLWIF